MLSQLRCREWARDGWVQSLLSVVTPLLGSSVARDAAGVRPAHGSAPPAAAGRGGVLRQARARPEFGGASLHTPRARACAQAQGKLCLLGPIAAGAAQVGYRWFAKKLNKTPDLAGAVAVTDKSATIPCYYPLLSGIIADTVSHTSNDPLTTYTFLPCRPHSPGTWRQAAAGAVAPGRGGAATAFYPP